VARAAPPGGAAHGTQHGTRDANRSVENQHLKFPMVLEKWDACSLSPGENVHLNIGVSCHPCQKRPISRHTDTFRRRAIHTVVCRDVTIIEFMMVSNVLIGGLAGYYLQTTFITFDEAEEIECEWRLIFKAASSRLGLLDYEAGPS
jgi:hypothetical protein